MSKTLNVSELAAELGVSRMTIYRMAKAGELPSPLQTGRRLTKYLKSGIELWMLEGCPDRETFESLKRTERRFAKHRGQV